MDSNADRNREVAHDNGQSPWRNEATNELIKPGQAVHSITKNADAHNHMDEYKDLLSQRLAEEAKKDAGNHPRIMQSHVLTGRPVDSAQTKSLIGLLDKDLAKSNLSDSDKSAFDNNMRIFLNRAHAQGLDEQAEADSTLKQCDRLLNPQSNELYLDGLFGKDEGTRLRTMLAEQIMNEAAYPSETCQGHFGTCNVTALETRTWFDRPSVASGIIADQALTGQWAGVDGQVIKLPQMDFTPDKYSTLAAPPVIDRTYAGQLFQATALSDAGSRQDTPVYYATGGISKSENGGEVGVEYWSDAHGKEVQPYDGLGVVSLAREMARLDGENTEILCSDPLALLAGSAANEVIFNSKEDLKEKLKVAQESGKMPVIMTVASGDKFFGSHGIPNHDLNHYICIDKYDPETGNLVIDNQWSPGSDWGTKSVLGSAEDVNPVTNIDDFFPATQGVKDPGIKEIELADTSKIPIRWGEIRCNHIVLEVD